MGPSFNYRGDRDVRASQVVLVIKNPPANAEDVRDVGPIPGSGESHGQRSLAGYSPWGCRVGQDS